VLFLPGIETTIHCYYFIQFKVMSFVCDLNSFQFGRSPGKEGSHFNPYSNLFPPNERKGIALSTLCWVIMFSLLIYLSFITSPLLMLKVYGVPYWVNPHSYTVTSFSSSF